MSTQQVCERVEQIAVTCTEPMSERDEITSALNDISRVESWAAARRSELVKKLAEIPGAFPEADIADTTGCTLNAATRETERSKTLGVANAFADALDSGDIRPGHVDALTRAANSLSGDQAALLLDQQDRLAVVAGSSSINDFEKHLRRTAKSLQSEADADARLERQRRNTRLRYWVDPTDDMWCISGRFDPKSGAELQRMLESVVTTKCNDATTETASSDPVARRQHLTALALVDLTTGTSSGTTRPGDPIVVVDATTSGEEPIADWGISAELPLSVLRSVLDVAEPDTVVVANGIVLYAPGTLDHGRGSRLATHEQRRALNGLYATCAVPGCAVHYDHCKLHHIVWWRNGGRTDLDNLLPVCQHHHTKLHNENWHMALGPNRELTVRFPDGRILTTGPPDRGKRRTWT